MGWSLNHQKMYNSELKDFFIQSLGRALYIATMFEEKCKFVLSIAKLEGYVKEGNSLSDSDDIAKLLKENMLGRTISEMAVASPVSQEDIDKLTLAKDARNFIAHEAALLGRPLATIRSRTVLRQLQQLGDKLDDLIAGDNLVSGWVYEIEEKGFPPKYLISEYPPRAREWVFSGVDLNELASLDFSADDPPSLMQLLKRLETDSPPEPQKGS